MFVPSSSTVVKYLVKNGYSHRAIAREVSCAPIVIKRLFDSGPTASVSHDVRERLEALYKRQVEFLEADAKFRKEHGL